ncbi:MAG: TIGR03757 family integrating conjugative element protein [Pseudomonadota bacterium]
MTVASVTCTAEVTVYTTSFLPVRNVPADGVQLYYLDAPKKPMSALSIGLPDTLDEAKVVAVARINSEKGKRLLGDLKRAYQGIVNAWRHQLTDLPAVMVDDRYVVYGVYDVGKALSMIKEYRGQK